MNSDSIEEMEMAGEDWLKKAEEFQRHLKQVTKERDEMKRRVEAGDVARARTPQDMDRTLTLIFAKS